MRRHPTPLSGGPLLLIALLAGLSPWLAAAEAGSQVSSDSPALAGTAKGGTLCSPDETTLCLNNGRFMVEMTWRDFDDAEGSGRTLTFSDNTGFFWFSDPDQMDMTVKVLDGCEVNKRFWVFFSGLTTLEHSLRVTDLEAGQVRVYFNPLGNVAQPGFDTAAFETCPEESSARTANGAARSSTVTDPITEPSTPEDKQTGGSCVADARTLCLSGGRYAVRADGRDFQNNTFTGNAGTLTDGTGYFWFFSPDNIELVAKVLDARTENGNFWFFNGALTTIEFTLTVTDSVTGTETAVFSPLGPSINQIVNVTSLTDLSVGDVALRACVDELGNVTVGDVTSLTCDDRGIVSLQGLEVFTDLGFLSLKQNQISDLGPLAALGLNNLVTPSPSLETLFLDHNQIVDLTPLGAQTNLRELGLPFNAITDLSALAQLSALENLSASDNLLSDVSPIAGLTGLTSLNLNGNQIEDAGPLSNLRDLDALSLERNQLSDISALGGLTALRSLMLSDNAIADPAPLANLTALRTLGLMATGLGDIGALTGLGGLTHLELGHNQIANIAPLTNLRRLEELGLGNNLIENLLPLQGLDELRHLDLSHNQVWELNPLGALTALEDLRLEFNRVSGLSPLGQLASLVTLRLGNNLILELEPLGGLTRLEQLTLNDNWISDIAPLLELTTLQSLDLSGNVSIPCGDLDDLEAALNTTTITGPDACGVEAPRTALAASMLPGGRSVRLGGAVASAFVSLSNIGGETAMHCGFELATEAPVTLAHHTTDPDSNAINGAAGARVDIPPGATQSYVALLTPTAAFGPTELAFDFGCDNTDPAPVVPGLNTLLISASTDPVPDIVAVAETPSGDGIAHISDGAGLFVVAAINLGAVGQLTVSADTGDGVPGLVLGLCETDPLTSQCIHPAAPTTGNLTTIMDSGETPTFAVFLSASGDIPFDPAVNRVFVRFSDGGGVPRGSTGVAVRTD